MRADRLISILMLLQNKPQMTAKELARELGVAERTIYRDIEALGTAGVPIQAEAGLGGGYSLPPDYRTKADGLNKADIQALFLLMNEQPFRQLGIGASLRSALLKIFNALPQSLQEDAEWIQNRLLVDMEGWSRHREQERYLKLAQQAVWEQRAASIMYTDRAQQRLELDLEPYGLVVKGGVWFIVGHIGEGAIRVFRLAKIHALKLEERRFERPDGFRLEACWRQWVAYFERNRYGYETVLEADRQALVGLARWNGWVREESAEGGGDSRDGKFAVRSRVLFENEEAALSAVLAQAGGVRVLAPPELRRRLRDQAAALTAEYAKPAPPGDR